VGNDPEVRWVHYRGAVSYDALHQIYAEADIGNFASSCENLPIILLVTMAAGLPVVCSNQLIRVFIDARAFPFYLYSKLY